MFIVLDELDARARRAQQLRSSPLTVWYFPLTLWMVANLFTDAKQARELVAVLTESKQQIDPRLAEMARYSGGGGNRSYGRGGGRGGRGGGGGFTGSNSAALGRSRW